MELSIDDIIARYGKEVAALTQRVIFAEARADAAEKELSTMKEKEQTSGE